MSFIVYQPPAYTDCCQCVIIVATFLLPLTHRMRCLSVYYLITNRVCVFLWSLITLVCCMRTSNNLHSPSSCTSFLNSTFSAAHVSFSTEASLLELRWSHAQALCHTRISLPLIPPIELTCLTKTSDACVSI